jgi:hypothetical protein
MGERLAAFARLDLRATRAAIPLGEDTAALCGLT